MCLVFDQNEYMKNRRKNKKTFSVLIEHEKMERFEQKLKIKNKTKSQWLNEKIDEELKK